MMISAQQYGPGDSEEKELLRLYKEKRANARWRKSQSPKLLKIIDIIYDFSDDLSDGYEYYGGRSAVRRMAKRILKELHES